MKAEILASAIGSVAALLAKPTLAARAVDCAKVTGALSVLKNLGPPATMFSSRYLLQRRSLLQRPHCVRAFVSLSYVASLTFCAALSSHRPQ